MEKNIRSYRFEVSVLVPELADLEFVKETLILKTWNLSDLIDINIYLFNLSCPMYSFSENSGGKLPEQEALVFNFFCRNSCYCFCSISEIVVPLCLKLRTKVASHVPIPTP